MKQRRIPRNELEIYSIESLLEIECTSQPTQISPSKTK